MLEAEAKYNPMLSLEGIKSAKGEVVNMDKCVVPLIESSPNEFSLNREGDMMVWLHKWNF